ncbi:MAG: replication initiation protein [Cetobacterium sp.]
MSRKQLHCANTFNAFSIGSLKSKQIDFLYGIGYKMYLSNDLEAELDGDEFRELIDYNKYTSLDLFKKDVIEFLKAINSISFVNEENKEVAVRSLFDDLRFNLETKTLKVVARPIFLEFFNNVMKAEYTIIDLKDLTSLKSSYSKLMYKLLKQWNRVGHKEFTLEELYHLLGVPKSTQTTQNFKTKVLKPIKQELPKYFNDLKIEPIRTGRKISSYKFTWKKSKSKILDAEVVEPIVIADKKVFEESIYKSENFKKWWHDNIKGLTFYNSYIQHIENLKMNEAETKQYLISQVACLNSGVHSGVVINAIKNKTRISASVSIEKDSILEAKKKIDIEKETVNKDILNLIPSKNKNNIPQEIVKIKITKEMYEDLYIKFLEENNTEHNNLTKKGFDRMNSSKYEIIEKRILKDDILEIKAIKDYLTEEELENNAQYKENVKFIEFLNFVQSKVNDLELSFIEKTRLNVRIAKCTNTIDIANICIENNIEL